MRDGAVDLVIGDAAVVDACAATKNRLSGSEDVPSETGTGTEVLVVMRHISRRREIRVRDRIDRHELMFVPEAEVDGHTARQMVVVLEEY